MPVGYDLKLSCQKIIYFELHAKQINVDRLFITN
jgi:hypothetical protein